MTDYIDRQAAIDAVMISPQKWDGMYIQDLNCRLRDALNALPSAEVEPVKRGKWEGVFCSVCGEEAITEWNDTGGEHIFSPYCPNCGAKMEPISASSENGQEQRRSPDEHEAHEGL